MTSMREQLDVGWNALAFHHDGVGGLCGWWNAKGIPPYGAAMRRRVRPFEIMVRAMNGMREWSDLGWNALAFHHDGVGGLCGWWNAKGIPPYCDAPAAEMGAIDRK